MPYRLAIPQYMEAVRGIEPRSKGYKALVLPLNYTAIKGDMAVSPIAKPWNRTTPHCSTV